MTVLNHELSVTIFVVNILAQSNKLGIKEQEIICNKNLYQQIHQYIFYSLDLCNKIWVYLIIMIK